MLIPLLLAFAGTAVVVAVAASGRPPTTRPSSGATDFYVEPTVFEAIPWTGPLPDPTAPRASRFLSQHTLYASGGKSVGLAVDVPGGRYTVTVRARTPDIGYKIKLNRKWYGIGWGPPGSTPVLSLISKAVTIVANSIPTAGAATSPQAAAIATAIEALVSIVDKLPDLVARARVKLWTEFRAGRWGTGKKRKGIRAALAKWYGDDAGALASVSNPHGYWRLAGDAAGPWPVVATQPDGGGDPGDPLSGPPKVITTELVGDYLKLTIETAPMEHPGEVRYDVTIRER